MAITICVCEINAKAVKRTDISFSVEAFLMILNVIVYLFIREYIQFMRLYQPNFVFEIDFFLKLETLVHRYTE